LEFLLRPAGVDALHQRFNATTDLLGLVAAYLRGADGLID